MKIEINVREEHIINGVCVEASECAIALAVKDVLGEVAVFDSIAVEDLSELSGERDLCPLPKEAFSFVLAFDETNGIAKGKDRLKYLQPFTFTVDIPDDKLLEILPSSTIEEAKWLINSSENLKTVEA